MEMQNDCNVLEATWLTGEEGGNAIIEDARRFGEADFNRFEVARLAFLQYTNAFYASCIYFEGWIDCEQKALEAMRISLDAWEEPMLVERFATTRPGFFEGVDYDLVDQWRDYLHCPVFCMRTFGQKALFMCESRVFEVVSLGRSWDDMVPIVPALVLTTLLPYDDIIVGDGLLMRSTGELEGPGVLRIGREFEAGKNRGIVRDAASFAQCVHEINDLHTRKGLDPTCYAMMCHFVEEINRRTSDTCFPYDVVDHVRNWDAA